MDPPCVIRRAEQASSAKPYGQHQPKRLHPACAHGLLPDTHYSRPRQSAGPSTGRTILRAPHPSRRHRKRFRSWRRPPLVSRSGRSPASAGTFFALLLRTHRRGPRSQDSSEKQVRLLSILRISPTQNQSLRFLQTAIHPISENLTPATQIASPKHTPSAWMMLTKPTRGLITFQILFRSPATLHKPQPVIPH